jgi:hypothetical protein
LAAVNIQDRNYALATDFAPRNHELRGILEVIHFSLPIVPNSPCLKNIISPFTQTGNYFLDDCRQNGEFGAHWFYMDKVSRGLICLAYNIGLLILTVWTRSIGAIARLIVWVVHHAMLCAGTIKRSARICRYCGRDLPEAQAGEVL